MSCQTSLSGLNSNLPTKFATSYGFTLTCLDAFVDVICVSSVNGNVSKSPLLVIVDDKPLL